MTDQKTEQEKCRFMQGRCTVCGEPESGMCSGGPTDAPVPLSSRTKDEMQNEDLTHMDTPGASTDEATGGKNELASPTPEPIDIAIVEIANGIGRLLNAGLTERAIVLLIHDAIGGNRVTKDAIRMVLDAARRLPELYVIAALSPSAREKGKEDDRSDISEDQ